MDNLLLLIHRMPYPPNKGDKIRSHHLLAHLAQRYRVYLGTFIDDADDWQHVPRVHSLCADAHFAALDPWRARVRSLGALLANRSLSLDYYRDAGLKAWVAQTMAAHSIDRILVFSSAMAQYAEPYPAARRIVDFVDIDSDKWQQYAQKKKPPMSWLYAHEARQLLRYERKVAGECDAALFVSEPEAALFRTLAPESSARIGHVNNGVDTRYFSPANAGPTPYGADEQAIVFTGAMDYWPNIDAVQWFAANVFPAMRAANAGARFYIVGARPGAAVSALASEPGVIVTGTVPDVRPFIAHARIAVAPLRVARGVQNKVLEAMAMAQTVAVSPQALEGIEATPGVDLHLCADAAGFIDVVGRILAQPEPAMGALARSRVEQRYSWAGNLAQIDVLLDAGSASATADAAVDTTADTAADAGARAVAGLAAVSASPPFAANLEAVRK